MSLAIMNTCKKHVIINTLNRLHTVCKHTASKVRALHGMHGQCLDTSQSPQGNRLTSTAKASGLRRSLALTRLLTSGLFRGCPKPVDDLSLKYRHVFWFMSLSFWRRMWRMLDVNMLNFLGCRVPWQYTFLRNGTIVVVCII